MSKKHILALAAGLLVTLVGSLSPQLPAARTLEAEAATPPQVIPESIVRPEYPEDAKRDAVGGRVVVEAVVRADGQPDELELVEEVPEYPSLGQSALAALRQWEFVPAQKDGEPVAFVIRVPFVFTVE